MLDASYVMKRQFLFCSQPVQPFKLSVTILLQEKSGCKTLSTKYYVPGQILANKDKSRSISSTERLGNVGMVMDILMTLKDVFLFLWKPIAG